MVGALGQASRKPQVSAGINVKFLGLGKAGSPCRVCVGAGFWPRGPCVPMAMPAPAPRVCLGATMAAFFTALAYRTEGSPGLSSAVAQKRAGPSPWPRPTHRRLSLGHSPGQGRARPAMYSGRNFSPKSFASIGPL